MKVFFEVQTRIEGWVEANNPHHAYHEFDRLVKFRLGRGVLSDQGANVGLIMEEPSYYVNGQVSKIRCFDAMTMENLDCGDINRNPCPQCKNGDKHNANELEQKTV